MPGLIFGFRGFGLYEYCCHPYRQPTPPPPPRQSTDLSTVWVPSTPAPPKDHNADKEFSVLAWNIWCDPRKEDLIDGKFHNFESRMKRLVHLVKERNPTILLLVEFSDHCKAHLHDLDKWYDWKYSPGSGKVRIGIRKGAHIVHDEVHQKHHHDHGIQFPHGNHCRGNWFRIKLPGRHTWVTVAGVHLASGGHAENDKRISLGRLFEHLKDRQPAIVMGDCNWFGRSGEDKINIKDVQHHEHFHDCAAVMEKEKATLLAGRKFAWRLDRIFYTKGCGLEPLEYDLVGTEEVPGARAALKDKHTDAKDGKGGKLKEAHYYVSDHLGLYARFRLDHHV